MEIRYPEVGVCGLSCRLCPIFHTSGVSRCTGSKGERRMAAGSPFIACTVKRKGIELCWECDESSACERWARHRAAGREREGLLREMLAAFNEGRSKTFSSVAFTVLSARHVRAALEEARLEAGPEADVRARSKALHARLEAAATCDRGAGLSLPRRQLSLPRLPHASRGSLRCLRGVPSGCGHPRRRDSGVRRTRLLPPLRLVRLPDRLMPTHEPWTIRRESWLPPLPLTRR